MHQELYAKTLTISRLACGKKKGKGDGGPEDRQSAQGVWTAGLRELQKEAGKARSQWKRLIPIGQAASLESECRRGEETRVRSTSQGV